MLLFHHLTALNVRVSEQLSDPPSSISPLSSTSSPSHPVALLCSLSRNVSLCLRINENSIHVP